MPCIVNVYGQTSLTAQMFVRLHIDLDTIRASIGVE